MKRNFLKAVLATFLIFVSACSTSRNEEKITLSKVQKEIKYGMSSAEVVEILGSPNMITTDSKHRETWVYDHVSTTSTASKSFGTLLLLGGSSAETSSSQKILTIIIKFDEDSKVRDFSYRSSKF